MLLAGLHSSCPWCQCTLSPAYHRCKTGSAEYPGIPHNTSHPGKKFAQLWTLSKREGHVKSMSKKIERFCKIHGPVWKKIRLQKINYVCALLLWSVAKSGSRMSEAWCGREGLSQGHCQTIPKTDHIFPRTSSLKLHNPQSGFQTHFGGRRLGSLGRRCTAMGRRQRLNWQL